MAKDTEKLIRQLSLISFLMAERRPVTALEIKREVEGYSGMNDDAFARRFYADRAELESLGIELKVDKPAEGYYEAENYTLPPENFYLPPIEFSDSELAALRTALSLLDGQFAYAEPLRLALQQLSWGKPSPLDTSDRGAIALFEHAGASGRELSQRLSKIETAIFRRKTILFDYYTMGRGEQGKRKVDPYHLYFEDGQFYLVGYSHERDDIRVFRLSRIRGKVGYSTKAEHDFSKPEDFDPRKYVGRGSWQLGDPVGTARIWLSSRIDWQIERRDSRRGRMLEASEVEEAPSEGRVFETEYADSGRMVGWALALGDRARILSPPELVEAAQERVCLVVERHSGELELAREVAPRPLPLEEPEPNGKREAPIRPERFARLVTLAGILIEATRTGDPLDVGEVRESLQVSDGELREDIDLLNVVNFGGGSYVLYAEIQGDHIEVDPEPYGDNFARPATLLPLEAKALVAAIDYLGEHLPQGSLASARKKIVDALGRDPADDGLQMTTPGADDPQIVRVVNQAIARGRLLEIEHYKEDEDEFSKRVLEPYKLFNTHEGWYLHAYDPKKNDTRTFKLERIRAATVLSDKFERRPDVSVDDLSWPVTGQIENSQVAKVWVAPEQAARTKEARRVFAELADGSVIAELRYAGDDYLIAQILREAGDFVVLEPEEARAAVLSAAEALVAETVRG
jgi:proteasome accessory factor BC